MTEPMNFQSMINALQNYWAEQGCLIWQPYYQQVGAGTMNPATFLRVLGPEPWNVGYVEPSVRPDDGRYGENPNRLQMHYQYQVIMKPDPGNPQELYLGSLQAIGINPHEHDIRFVEDNWNSPALGAWGLGWEVWLDGLEITQFTYFQQAGGLNLDPVAVEITYGLDRIAAPLQGVRGFTNIQWNDSHTFGDVNLQGEQEHSKYYFEVADVERTRKIYNLFEEELNLALDAGLILPAYDHLIKLSHYFNVLDTRGAIGVTERAGYFRQMRNLATKIANLYVEDRQNQEFPWLIDDSTESVLKGALRNLPLQQVALGSLPTKPATFLLEIGTEELPSNDLNYALAQLTDAIPAMLKELRLEHGNVKVMGTPRRLVVLVEDLSPTQPDWEEIVKGPPAARAFGPGGEPTKAAEGFAASKGLSVNDLETREIDGGNYVVALVKEKGLPAVQVLSEKIPELIANIRFEKSMRWNSSNIAFSRPIRWLMGLFGDVLIPFEYAGYSSQKVTRGLRFADQPEMTVNDTDDYFNKIIAQGIVVDANVRKQTILEQLRKISAEMKADMPDDPGLLEEVTNLVEAPTALVGSFDETHLALPREVLISVMKKHQRYFALEKDGKLLPAFITIANGSLKNQDLVRSGNEAVVRARFADAAFFVNEDEKKKLEDYLPDLDTLTFQKDLGSMLEKTERITTLVSSLADQFSLTQEEVDTVKRAARLCKTDLVTSMVVEMTSLQGIMGRYYALKAGEKPEVAAAIEEHYSSSPKSKAGLVLGTADRLDSLTGLFAAGLAPTGNKDPFAQRRAAVGLVESLIAWQADVDLEKSIAQAAKTLPVTADAETMSSVMEFILGRLRVILIEKGYRYDIVDAVLSVQGNNPAGAARAVEALSEKVSKDNWDKTLAAYSRCVRITRSHSETYSVDKYSLKEASEKALIEALEKAEAVSRKPGNVRDFFNAFEPMIPAINKFFEDVLVMSEDKQEKANRLGLLQRIAGLTTGVFDLSGMEGF
ncbi:MAG: glycine--tRNA ligase subunit beta [Anaerolineales bacterium]|nr:glycine--tRNA ligase subunit beta [Anaerolineales bacterium]